MKKYVLSYKDFLKTSKLQEAVLTPEQAKKYSKIQVIKDVKDIHNKIFGEQERIYLPFDPSLFNINLGKSELQETIEELLTSNGYEIVSYTQNQCVKIGQKNITKIGKVLVSKNINRKDLADSYGQEVDKLKAVKDSNNLLVVFSRNYDDVASMSTKKAWNSCQNLDPDSGYSAYLKEYVAKDLEQGSIIAYLIKSTDKEILDPEARILIKPFINTKDSKDIVLLPCTKTYHRGLKTNTPLVYPKFPEFVMGWVKQVQPDINGTYKMNDKVYQDGGTTLKIKKPLTKEEKERAENPKTVEDLGLAFDYYYLDLDISKVQMDSNGLWTYNGGIDFSNNKDFKEFPKCFKTLKEIKGTLDCYKTSITSFEGLENLQTIGENLYCSNTPLKSFKGLENLQTIGENLYCPNTSLQSFVGLEKLQTIGESLYCSETSITSFKGLEKLQSIGNIENYTGSLICSNTPLQSFEGLENLQKIGESLYCYKTSITSFKGLENLQTIGWYLDCYETPLKSFEGLENLKSIGGRLYCHGTSITSFNGLSKDIKINGSIEPKELKDMFYKFKNS